MPRMPPGPWHVKQPFAAATSQPLWTRLTFLRRQTRMATEARTSRRATTASTRPVLVNRALLVVLAKSRACSIRRVTAAPQRARLRRALLLLLAGLGGCRPPAPAPPRPSGPVLRLGPERTQVPYDDPRAEDKRVL